MPESQPWRQKYGTRFVVNAVLLAIVWTLSWIWFNAHVKPHISALLFSGVSVATIATFAVALFGSFFDKGEADNILRALLRSEKLTPALIALLPVIAVAHLTTFTLYLKAGDKFDDVRVNVTSGEWSRPRPVALSSSEKQKAVSYFFTFRPVTVHVDTQAPSGYRTIDVPLRRGIPVQITVPDSKAVKPFYLVRLMPLYELFQLRGRKEPDMRYVVRVFLPGQEKPIERAGLSFRAIYFGASLNDLKPQSKNDRPLVTELRNTLLAIDRDITPTDIDAIVADWLDDPEFIPTPELKPGDKVRVELQGPAGKSEMTVNVAAQLNNAFLKGAVD